MEYKEMPRGSGVFFYIGAAKRSREFDLMMRKKTWDSWHTQPAS